MKTIIILALLLSGCASIGKNFTMDQANRVKNGMTRDQVVQIMGSKPSAVADAGNVFVWRYVRTNGLSGMTISRQVKFSFDDAGKTYEIPDGGVYGDAAKYQ